MDCKDRKHLNNDKLMSMDDWNVSVSGKTLLSIWDFIKSPKQFINNFSERNKKHYEYVYECGCIAKDGPSSPHYCPDHPWMVITKVEK